MPGGQEEGPQVSGSDCEAPQVFVDAQALLLKIVKHLIEPKLYIPNTPISLFVSSELQRRGEDSNLRRQDYWRSGLLLLARCIKPLCHLSS